MNNTDPAQKALYNFSYLLELVFSAINGTVPPEPDEQVDFEKLYGFAKLHNVHNIAYYAIERLSCRPETKLRKKWENKRNECFHRNLIQTSEFERICALFEQNKIEYLPVKGFFLSNLYPQPDYRHTCDLDFLLKKEDLKKAGKLANSIGYATELEGTLHHDIYRKPPFMNLELHHELFGIRSQFHSYYQNIMEKCVRKGEYHLELTPEDAYIFVLAHMYKHYSETGTGIRSVIDIYLLNKKLLPNLDKDYIKGELTKLSIADFADEIAEIAEKWFVRRELSDFSETELYILTSGTYGTTNHKVSRLVEKNGKGKYILKRLFPSPDSMKDVFHQLRARPYLLPAFYVYRFFLLLLPSKRKNLSQELRSLKKSK